MYQNYTYYPQAQPVRNTTSFSSQYGLKGRPVSSLEEARAMSIDFDGSVFYFPDLANRRIYTKQINVDGTSSLNMYELKEMPIIENNESENYVTREEFNDALGQIQEMLNAFQPNSQAMLNKTQDTPSYSF